ncbi:hypothetical protein A2630_02510 [Candidatus Woesebacteria bacterium RIFCSPHIGHO2_01_FULL_44_10]|uniref:dUTPase-like domain-containing protein n=1 Tax=Candidatus Woesebacteria bacterium RIFCSPLOWO2_01_FULL_44_14 TaxID=1802525 RepID=A0A1F8C4U3_9BACT|nr:MAG: hypothetical protein A2630_02510 [Candidatus Woesebacteria bacterium RIFCSPHIGHO2_01_FULL_44_10]OGM55646.1 MAG: hypothetical protein A3F62_02435 [Candidatus Woesebacteria bacterium RIFCSPHIGHO2_12_FULL_44_11]OGM70919.1 MAG: hypothetical protein A2975_01425 [Candidatus Woesebacteria bacterium RIFCSPLOWO2_01_FULL_44_14]
MIDREGGLDSIKYSLLSRDAILAHMQAGNVAIDPFDSRNLGTASYDVTLGSHFFREQAPVTINPGFYSPWDRDHIRDVWGRPEYAERARMVFADSRTPVPEGIDPDDRVIIIRPQETVLCHTQEFIGGRNCVTTMMKARSSLGRNFIEICKCAGWGDVGYINRWTMEVTNNSRYYAIPLVVGRRVAQIAFFQVDTFSGTDYVQEGKYQTEQDLERVKKEWLPHHMLPQMWKDWEVGESESDA